MRRIMMLAALAAMLVVSAIPVAFAQDRDERQEDRQEDRQERFEENGFFFFDEDRFDDGFFFDEEDFDEDGFFFGEGDFDEEDFDNGISQDVEQDAESGDVDQSFDVSGAGDNSNQCVGIQGVANTGNAQNQIGVLQYASEADDFDFEDTGADIEVSPEASTTCDQQVNQAASAFGK